MPDGSAVRANCAPQEPEQPALTRFGGDITERRDMDLYPDIGRSQGVRCVVQVKLRDKILGADRTQPLAIPPHRLSECDPDRIILLHCIAPATSHHH